VSLLYVKLGCGEWSTEEKRETKADTRRHTRKEFIDLTSQCRHSTGQTDAKALTDRRKEYSTTE
jgi:hypothetical protein